MKKVVFVVMMLFIAGFAYSDPVDDAKSVLEKSNDLYKQFQDKYTTLKAYDTTKRSQDALKQLVDMISRYKKLVEDKVEEIESIERANKVVPVLEFDQLKELINRYHQMTVDLDNWINPKKK
ncbi:hypothetical protein [Treponema sp. R6D11]